MEMFQNIWRLSLSAVAGFLAFSLGLAYGPSPYALVTPTGMGVLVFLLCCGRSLPLTNLSRISGWENLAASRSTGEAREDAVRSREIVAGEMPPEQIADAQRLTCDWDAAHPPEP